ncbi:MAG: glycosyltransferase family 2 protein [Acidimicrobiales bacterium]
MLSELLALLGTDDAAAAAQLTGPALEGKASTVEYGLLRGKPETYSLGSPKGHGRSVSDARRVILAAATVAHLRKAQPLLGRYGRSRQIIVAVLSTDRPDLLSVPPVLTRDLLDEAQIRVIDGGSGGIVVRLSLRRRATVQDVVRALLVPPRQGGGVWPGAGLRLGLTEVAAAAWAAGDPWARTVSKRALAIDSDDIPPVDVLIGPEVRAEAPASLDPPAVNPRIGQRPWTWAGTATGSDVAAFVRQAGLDVARPGLPWSVAAPMLPPVDITTISPRGFLINPSDIEGRARCRAGSATWDVLDEQGRRLTTLAVDEGIGEDAIFRLRTLRHVVVNPGRGRGPVEIAVLLASLASAGVPVVLSGPLAGVTRELLGPVADQLEALHRHVTGDNLAREAWSVRTRRQALLRFGPAARWHAFGAQLGRTTAPLPSMSVILPTKRPANLRFALSQVDRQSWPEVEVVVALHGVPAAHPAVVDAVAGSSRPVQVVEVDAKTVFGDVLNAAVDRCSGRFIAKMDDDDWYGPHHLTDLLLAHAYSSATLVGLADHYVYLADSDLTVRDVAHGTERWATRVSGGTLTIARDDLLAVGRWRPVRRAVDRCLIQAVGALGGHLYAMHDLGFCLYRGAADHTWNPGDEHFVARGPMTWPGFAPPAELYPTPHPALASC